MSEWIENDGSRNMAVPFGTEIEFKCRAGQTGITIIDQFTNGDAFTLTGSSFDWVRYRIINGKSHGDMVNSPSHYKQGEIECIDAIKSALTPEEFRGYCKGNALKYIWREKHKGGDESLQKAVWYLNKLME